MKRTFGFVLPILAIAACSPVEYDEEILKIGLILPLTGPASSIGEIYLEGATLAVEDLNSQKIIDQEIVLVVEDTNSQPKNAVLALEKLLSQDIDFYASLASSHALVMKPIVEEQQVLMFADAAHPDVTKNAQYVFRHSNIAEEEARILAWEVADKKTIGILYGEDDYGVIVHNIAAEYLETTNAETVSQSFDTKATDLRSQITKLLETDAIIVVGFGSAFNLALQQLYDMNYEGKIITSVGFVLTPSFSLGEIVDGVYHTDYPFTFVDTWEEFEIKYEARFSKEAKPFHAIPYGSIELLVNAIAEAKSTDPTEVADTIRRIGTFHGRYETITLQGNDAVIPLVVSQYEYN